MSEGNLTSIEDPKLRKTASAAIFFKMVAIIFGPYLKNCSHVCVDKLWKVLYFLQKCNFLIIRCSMIFSLLSFKK
jgi:hypothetical protein